ncbi:MAG: hypothetical protein IJV17_03055 [Prevotella sp.]|nr:hypothetical protein [Prevotella sp.]
MSKKTYETPWMSIIVLHTGTSLLAGNDVITPGEDNAPPGVRMFGFDNEEEMLPNILFP